MGYDPIDAPVWRFARPRKPAGDESARRWPSCCARSRLTKLCGGYIFRQEALLRSVDLHKVVGCRETHSYACRFRQTSLAPTWLTSSLRLGLRPRNAPKCRPASQWLALLVSCPRLGRSFRVISCRPKGRFRVWAGRPAVRLKLAGRERRKLVCSPLDEPLASNRVSDCLHAQFSWLKNLQRQRLPPRVVAAEAETRAPAS